ncbi:hypothetical protein BZL29_5419 [Mycobacterium kansasii]|uniref:Uncharacterized protein n=1 Tax=Mycobacterium kansasii TaxID=1768 RepID=A0A1V3WWE5_MYCKA|nr:hypothetical protein BZL29_5419 [Mycobacterium kansasii]
MVIASQCSGVIGVALGQRDPLVQAQQVVVVGVAVGDQDDHVVHRGCQFGRDEVECVGNQFVEPLRVHPHRHGLTFRRGLGGCGASGAGAPAAPALGRRGWVAGAAGAWVVAGAAGAWVVAGAAGARDGVTTGC